MVARISALVVWALVAATVVFWGLRLFARPPAAPAFAVAVGDAAAARGDLARLLGAAPAVAATPAAVVEAPSRFRLLGVMAPRPRFEGQGGVALIAVDGKPARAYPVGAAIDDALVLQSVNLRSASIGPAQGGSAMRLEMPPLPTAATGSLPPIGGAPVPSARFVPPAPPAQMQVPGGLQMPLPVPAIPASPDGQAGNPHGNQPAPVL